MFVNLRHSDDLLSLAFSVLMKNGHFSGSSLVTLTETSGVSTAPILYEKGDAMKPSQQPAAASQLVVNLSYFSSIP